MVVRHIVTAEELTHLADSGKKYELIDGELITMSPAKPDHSWIGSELAFLIKAFIDDRGMGEVFPGDTGFQLSQFPDTVLAPDVSFVSSDRLPSLDEWQGFFPFAPDLAVEIFSPSNTAQEMAGKVRRYFAAGSTMVVIVDPRLKIVDVNFLNSTSVRLQSGDKLDLGDVIPGLLIPVSSLFRRLP